MRRRERSLEEAQPLHVPEKETGHATEVDRFRSTLRGWLNSRPEVEVQNIVSPAAAAALAKASTWEEFIAARTFTFLHHFSGAGETGLGDVIIAEATRRGMIASHVSVDLRRHGVDLLGSEPYEEHKRLAAMHHWDGFHAGFPCGSASRVRHRRKLGRPTYPLPVRDAQEPYGLA